jgi:hypothetical protein
MLIGYVRISSADQDLSFQRNALTALTVSASTKTQVCWAAFLEDGSSGHIFGTARACICHTHTERVESFRIHPADNPRTTSARQLLPVTAPCVTLPPHILVGRLHCPRPPVPNAALPPASLQAYLVHPRSRERPGGRRTCASVYGQ